MTTTYWCELVWLGGDTVTAGVSVDVEGDRITAVRPTYGEPPSTATRLAGLTLPGMANAHSHAFHRLLRGATQIGVGSFWTWREQMYTAAERLTPESYHRLASAVFAEMALAGITCVGEFHYVHHGPGGMPYEDHNAMGAALIDAAAAAGVRITLLDTCYLHGGIGVELDPVQRRFGDGDALGWAARVSALDQLTSATARIGAAIHSVRAVDPASAEVVAAWAAERDAPLARWIQMAGERVAYQGLPARICWLGYGERHRLGLRFNEMVRRGQLSAPIVIGRDHLDSGSVASPYRETEAMLDGSDAIADWPLLNALVNTSCGATWVSIHHGGGVGIGRSIHAGMVCLADGTDLAAQKLERVLTADPGTGVMRHADAGYSRAIEVADERGVRIPMLEHD